MWIRYIFLFFIFSCKELNLENFDFTQHVDSHNLRIFGKSDVSPEFLDKVAQSYDAMFETNLKIDESMREDYLSTTKDKNVYQRVGLESSFQKNERYADKGNVPSPYRHNCTDFIWESTC